MLDPSNIGDIIHWYLVRDNDISLMKTAKLNCNNNDRDANRHPNDEKTKAWIKDWTLAYPYPKNNNIHAWFAEQKLPFYGDNSSHQLYPKARQWNLVFGLKHREHKSLISHKNNDIFNDYILSPNATTSLLTICNFNGWQIELEIFCIYALP